MGQTFVTEMDRLAVLQLVLILLQQQHNQQNSGK